MSVADLHDLELSWPSLSPTNVIVTGTFDQWLASIHLVKGDTGFSGTVKVPWGQKITYKFIVDGRWRCRDDQAQEDDGHGNINNVLQTPEKPFSLAHDPLARLSIPFESDGFGDIDNMVTAVEYLPHVEPTTIKGSLPLPVPQIIIEGLGQASSAGSPVSVSKLNTAAATEGHVSPTSEILAKPAAFQQAPGSGDISTPLVNGNGSASLSLANGNGVAPDPHGVSTRASIEAELPNPYPEPETMKGGVLESTVAQPPSSQGAQDPPAPTDHVDVASASTPVAGSEPTAKQPQVNPVESVAQGRQAMSPASIGQTSTSSSTPASSTLTHKKRRSLFAMIKRIFDKDSDKQGKKEKNKH